MAEKGLPANSTAWCLLLAEEGPPRVAEFCRFRRLWDTVPYSIPTTCAALRVSTLRAATADEIAQTLSFAPGFDGRKRVHHGDEMMVRITAERLVEHLERAEYSRDEAAPSATAVARPGASRRRRVISIITADAVGHCTLVGHSSARAGAPSRRRLRVQRPHRNGRRARAALWFGAGAELKIKALEKAVAMCGVAGEAACRRVTDIARQSG